VRAAIAEARHACNIMSFTVITFVFGVMTIELWDTELPVWGFVFALIIGVSARYI